MQAFRHSKAPKIFLLIHLQLSSADPTAERTVHTLRSSNLQFYTAVWDAAKASTGLVTFNKRFYWATPPTRSSKRAGRPKKQCALVDIVTRGGLEWVKVSTVTETRLLFEQAKAGWENADSSSDENGSSGDDETGATKDSPPASSSPSSSPSPSDNPIELLRLATDLQTASLATQIRYRHPKIRIVLPKIPTIPSPQTLVILNGLIATGATLQVGPSLSPFPPGLPSSESNATPLRPELSTIFSKLLPDPHITLTPTLNIDCTILLALISDLSHSPQTPHSPSHHKAITRQIELEARDHLLPESLYPALEGRNLVCTAEAATRMREIVEQIGTMSERARAELLLNDDRDKNKEAGVALSPSSLLSLFASHSEYAVPHTLRLPILVISAPIPDLLQQLPPVAQTIAEQLSAINRSVFLYGWARGISTVSSNRAVAKVVEETITDEGGGKVIGPEVWLCATARSLVGKERLRKA